MWHMRKTIKVSEVLSGFWLGQLTENRKGKPLKEVKKMTENPGVGTWSLKRTLLGRFFALGFLIPATGGIEEIKL